MAYSHQVDQVELFITTDLFIDTIMKKPAIQGLSNQLLYCLVSAAFLTGSGNWVTENTNEMLKGRAVPHRDTMLDGSSFNCDAYWKREVPQEPKMHIPTDACIVQSRMSERRRSCWMQEDRNKWATTVVKWADYTRCRQGSR